MAAALAEGAVRDELARQVQRLEDEVERLRADNASLRATLGEILAAAAKSMVADPARPTSG